MFFIKQAKIFHSELKSKGDSECLTGCLQKFKKSHCIILIMFSNEAYADYETLEKFFQEMNIGAPDGTNL